MIRDQGPNYQLGFGISPSNVPVETNEQGILQEGPNPQSGFIAKALHKHPMMRFFAISAASLAGMHIAGKFVRQGGTRLVKALGEESLPLIRKEWQTTLLADFRKTQSVLDEWQGVSNGVERAGLRHTQGLQERVRDAALAGEEVLEPEAWLFRDTIQQTLVRQARRLPYELPAMYATQRLLTDRLIGGKERADQHPKWYNPIDVIGDFATQSVKNVAFMMAPWEVGASGLKHGFRNLMTYGDFASSTSTFNPHIRGFSIGLRENLSQIGHDASSILHSGIQKSLRSTGAFSSAITHYNAASRNLRDQLGVREQDVWHTDRGGALGGIQNFAGEVFGYPRAVVSHARGAIHNLSAEPTIGPQLPMRAKARNTFDQVFPKFGGFRKGFTQSWDSDGEYFSNLNALRGNKKTYMWRGEQRNVNPALVRGGESELEQIAQSYNLWRGIPADVEEKTPFAGGQFARMRQVDEYKRLLEKELVDRQGIHPQAARDFVKHASIHDLPNRHTVTGAFKRVGFGNEEMLAEPTGRRFSPWHWQLQERIEGVVGEHARSVAERIDPAVKAVDKSFLKNSKAMRARIWKEWDETYKEGIIPYTKEHLGEAKMAYERFGPGMDSEDRELLIRKAAEHIGIPTLSSSGHVVSQRELLQELGKRGFATGDPHDMRNFLVDRGVVSNPWSREGFNALGLRPLDVRTALQRNYFRPDLEKTVGKLLKDVDSTDPFIGSMIRRPVGRGVYETMTGEIVDLSLLRGGLNRGLNAIEQHMQIPLLRFNPLSLFGWGAKRGMAESPIVQITSGEQQFGKIPGADFYLWMREHGGGRLFGHGEGGLKRIDGKFKPLPTDASSLLGRHIRFGLGDKGQRPVEDVRGPIRKALDFDVDQPQSLFRYFDRIRNRQGDLRNPAEYARFLQSSGGELRNLEQVEGYQPFERYLRRYGITGKVASLFEENEQLAGILQDAEGRSLESIRHPADMIRSVRTTLKKHVEELTTQIENAPDNPALRDQLIRVRRAQGLVQSRYLANEMRPGFFEGSSAQAMRSTGIHTRLDEFRADMYRYLAAHKAITEGSGESVIQSMLEHLDHLKMAKQIGKSEYTEARAAVLSMHVNLLKLETYTPELTSAGHIKEVLAQLMRSRSAGVLEDIAGYDTEVLHKAGPFDLHRVAARGWLRRFGRADYEYPGTEFNPFGADSQVQFAPTLGSIIKRNPLKALKSTAGISSWSDPDNFTTSAVPVSHFFQRLNRYFATLGAGVDETKYGGPIGFAAKGLIGKRVFPAVAIGTTAMAVDRTLGGYTRRRDEYGDRVYRPLISGAAATAIAGGQVGLAGAIPGGETAQQKREELFGEGEVAIRKGRWWPLGNQPWKGGRVQYYRPSWYKRFMSGYQYGDQNWSSPAERLGFGYDFSPGRLVDPYRWERKHKNDRPYPVSGEYFTGPWGPVTGGLNLTLGRLLKPSVRIREDDFNNAMGQYNPSGMYGLIPPSPENTSPTVATRNPTGSMGLFNTRWAGEVLNQPQPIAGPSPAVGGDWRSPYVQPWGFMGLPYGTSPNAASDSYRRRKTRLRKGDVAEDLSNVAPAAVGPALTGRTGTRSIAVDGPVTGRSVAGDQARQAITKTNTYYEGRSQGGGIQRPDYDPYRRVVLGKTRGFDPRVIPASNPIDPGSVKYQAGQLGYELQELFGIYGFMFGSLRESLGFGSQDMSPDKPVLQAASRGYGAERSFWDLNLGGLGDLPSTAEGEYGNLEFSEIARRFIPHRRRDITEVNPLSNDIGKMYPWLPDAGYFINFHQGDPYATIPEGELRLPGAGYERTHQLHPDATGKYGLIDQHAILGDVAPWSQEYRAIDRVIDKSRHMLSEEEYSQIKTTRRQVSSQNKRLDFAPYKYNEADFRQKEVKVFGFKPGDADTILTSDGPIRFAGTRVRSSQEARLFAENLIKPGSMAQVTYDANRPPGRDMPLDAIVEVNGRNINRALLDNPEVGRESQTSAPVDLKLREGGIEFMIHRFAEQIAHRNTILNTKFLPRRTAVEDWERNNVYGTTFPQWQHPIRDFLKPVGYKGMNRNPIISAAVLGVAGGMFFRSSSPAGKAAGRFFGSIIGFGIGMFSNAKSLETGHRFIPLQRRKELGIEEYTDILNYVKYSRLYAQTRQQAIAEEGADPEKMARKIEDSDYKKFQFANLGSATSQALTYRQKAMQTMYGADVYGDVLNLSAAIPKRKRDHFLEFLKAPVSERPRILSTAPRLERRIYEARWGMDVEKRPELVEYFSEHELPTPDWEGWNPNVDIEDVKLKIAKHQGLDVSQMGYYPQQVKEANLLNASYPDFRKQTPTHESAQQLDTLLTTQQRIQQYLNSQGIRGQVIAVPSARPGTRIELSAGVHG